MSSYKLIKPKLDNSLSKMEAVVKPTPTPKTENSSTDVSTMLSITSQLPYGYTYHFVTDPDKPPFYKSELNYYAHFRIAEVRNADAAKAWLDKFNESTKITFRILKTYPRTRSVNIFRTDYRCHFNTRTGNTQPVKKRVTKHTGCEAMLYIAIRRYEEYIDHDVMDRDYPCVVKLKNVHNHEVTTADALRFRTVSPATKAKLLQLFEDGYSPTQAMHKLQTDICCDFPHDYKSMLGDSCYRPSAPMCFQIYYKKYRVNHTPLTQEEILEKLMQIAMECQNGKCVVAHTENHTVIGICTNIMIRAHKLLPETGQVMFVDCIGSMNKKGYQIYMFVAPTPSGGVPIGCLIASVDKDKIFELGIQLLQQHCFPEGSFYGNNYPEVIMMDEYSKERAVLQTVFPNSKIVLSPAHFLRTIWMYLITVEPLVEDNDRLTLYFLMKEIVMTPIVKFCEVKYTCFVHSDLAIKYPHVASYLKNKWESGEEWAVCYHKDPSKVCTNISSYVDMSFWILKETVLDQLQSFMPPMRHYLDFFLHQHDKYLEMKLLGALRGKMRYSDLFKLLTDYSEVDVQAIQSGPLVDVYVVPSTGEQIECTVDISTFVCDCISDKAVFICKHIASILASSEKADTLFTVGSGVEVRNTLFEIATGNPVNEGYVIMPAEFKIVSPSKSTSLADVGDQADAIEDDDLIGVDDADDNDYAVDLDHSIDNEDVIDSVSELCDVGIEENEVNENDPGTEVLVEDVATCKLYVKEFCERVLNGINDSPEQFVPVVKKMRISESKYTATQDGLLSFVSSFGDDLDDSSEIGNS